jgi:hypothetical protein
MIANREITGMSDKDTLEFFKRMDARAKNILEGLVALTEWHTKLSKQQEEIIRILKEIRDK